MKLWMEKRDGGDGTGGRMLLDLLLASVVGLSIFGVRQRLLICTCTEYVGARYYCYAHALFPAYLPFTIAPVGTYSTKSAGAGSGGKSIPYSYASVST